MSKKAISAKHSKATPAATSPLYTICQNYSDLILAVLFCFAVLLSSLSTIREATMGSLIVLAAVGVWKFKVLRERITVPLLALSLFVLMCGISTFYAQSGKFALQEFLKVLFSYCTALSLLAIAPKGSNGGKWMATILSGGAAIISIVSIDLLSTHIISDLVVSFLNLFSIDYSQLKIVEKGTRMLSLLDKPNVYAGVAGIGVLLGLGLASSEETGWRRQTHLCFLFANALGFLLAFSMGASAMIALAFIAYLLLETKHNRGPVLVLMVETLVFSLCALIPISITSLNQWDGFQPIPLACLILGAALLCLTETFVGRKVADKLRSKGTLVLILIAAVLAATLAFAMAAYSLTGSIQLAKGASIQRSVYPESGEYTVSADGGNAVNVTITSQNREETMMHKSTTLYRGPLAEASFVVPEDSMVVYFTLSAAEDTTLNSVILHGAAGDFSVPLDYKLLPGFIANRLQGLFANQNAIQRTVFFEDGMTMFRRSPIIGLGMGGFENSLRSVQRFVYDTKYVHNHYIQVMLETGVVGLILFVGTLLTAAFALWRARKQETPHLLLPALGAVLVFMAGHAAVEVTFSLYCFLPFGIGSLALISLCAGNAISVPKFGNAARNITIIVAALLMAVFSFLLVQNMRAKAITSRAGATSADLMAAAAMDPFEWADYALSYVAGIPDEPSEYIRAQADAYAARLAEVDSNSIPKYLISYYLKTGQTEEAFAVAEKYVDYVAAASETWQTTFDRLMQYYQDTPEYRAGILRIVEKMNAWNEANMGTITLDAMTTTFLAQLEG